MAGISVGLALTVWMGFVSVVWGFALWRYYATRRKVFNGRLSDESLRNFSDVFIMTDAEAFWGVKDIKIED